MKNNGGVGSREQEGKQAGLPRREEPAERQRPGQVALLPVRPGSVLPVNEHNGEVLVVFDDVFHRIKLLKQTRKGMEIDISFLLVGTSTDVKFYLENRAG